MEREQHLEIYKALMDKALGRLDETEDAIRKAAKSKSPSCGKIHRLVDDSGDTLMKAEAHYKSAGAVGGRLKDAMNRYENAHQWFVKSCVRR